MNRRQLLLRGTLVAALAPVASAGHLASRSSTVFAVHDPAYRRSREFALALQHEGARVLALEPDVLATWHGTLLTACAALQKPRILGLTTRTDFLVLRDLARGAGLVPVAVRDADAGRARTRATLIGWALAPGAAAA
jgi:hypothetical protein